jgi:flagellar motor switch protein FliN/FliY
MADEDDDETQAENAEPPEDAAAEPPEDAGDAAGVADAPGAAPADAADSDADIDAVYDVPVKVTTVLGKTSIQVSELLKLGRGAIVELERKAGQPVDIYVNNQLVARGELVVVDDRLAITTTEIIKSNFNAS